MSTPAARSPRRSNPPLARSRRAPPGRRTILFPLPALPVGRRRRHEEEAGHALPRCKISSERIVWLRFFFLYMSMIPVCMSARMYGVSCVCLCCACGCLNFWWRGCVACLWFPFLFSFQKKVCPGFYWIGVCSGIVVCVDVFLINFVMVCSAHTSGYFGVCSVNML